MESVTNIFEDPGFVSQLERHWREEYNAGLDSYPVCAMLADPFLKDKEVRVLDAGCGVGRFAAMLPDHIEYVGIDSSIEMVLRARDNDKRCEHGSVYEIPFPDKYFDVVVCNSVLIHGGDVPRAGKKLWRDPKGRLICTFYWKWWPVHRLEPLLVENWKAGTSQWLIRNMIPRWMVTRLFKKHIRPAKCQFYFKDGVHLAKEKIAFVAADRTL